MELDMKVTFIEYEQLPIPIICFDKHIKINYLNNEAKSIIKRLKPIKDSYANNESEFAIPIWLSIKTQEFYLSNHNEQVYLKAIQSDEEGCFLELIFKKILNEDNYCNGIRLIIKDVSGYVRAKNEMQKELEEIKSFSEEQLVKLEKINSLSILAAGIAHDFNNILTIILGNIYIIKRYLNIITNKVNNKFSQIEKLIAQAQDLNQQLMSFSKDELPIKKTINIKGLIKKTAAMVLSGSSNRCIFSIAQDLWPVEVDESQIREVINNLLINAGQAMPKGGIIQVNATNVYVEGGNKRNIKQGKYIMLEIRDKGMGISKEDMDRIFKPYFTTKTNGTGLGLAASYSIIAKHNGYIHVESEISVGTSFYIYLRASEQEVINDKVKREKVILGTGKVLVMDDDKNIREINRLMLMEIGYEVELVKNGEEAIKAYKDSIIQNNVFDAVMIDLTIRGGMGGKETIAELLELDKEVNAIVVSGYSSDAAMNDCKAYGFKGCIKKPYNLEQLANVLNKVVSKTKQFI
ncbi:response regulator [Clostridium sp. CS001]|uniref:hybrid sensor histidine kinase/response regulator n=1 Tax=Clostridium sp. CS001 TaxID=2880648 RepID=UPI001CF54062|nr:ATP-binding protein [Clostridium sp. CS001]MCB2290679.1 response regulator [Clostridium sp. CS001]